MEPSKSEPDKSSTGAEGLRAWDEFWLTATPRIFEWLRWAITLAAVQFVANRTRSPWAFIVLILGYVALLNYYWAYFGKFRFGLSTATKSGRWLWSVLVVGIGYGTYWFVRLVVDAIVSAQP